MRGTKSPHQALSPPFIGEMGGGGFISFLAMVFNYKMSPYTL